VRLPSRRTYKAVDVYSQSFNKFKKEMAGYELSIDALVILAPPLLLLGYKQAELKEFMAPSKPDKAQANIMTFLGLAFLILTFVLATARLWIYDVTFKESDLSYKFFYAVNKVPSGFTLFASFSAYLTYVCFRQVQLHQVVSAKEKLEKDLRPPVLYLRSFSHDDDTIEKFRINAGGFIDLIPDASFEESLVPVLERLGPVVAIGRPGEIEVVPGAARLEATDDEWQDSVLSLMGEAQLVVFSIGISPGLFWEMEKAMERLGPSQIILVFNNFNLPVEFREQYYGFFRECVNHLFPRGLPLEIDNAIVLYFNNDWHPYFAYPTRSDVKSHQLRAAILEALSYHRPELAG